MAQELRFKLEKFEGPLDLLLHLIERDKIDIFDIPIVQITAEYMYYITTIWSTCGRWMKKIWMWSANSL